MRIFFLMFLAGMPLASAAIAETEYDFDTDLTLVASIPTRGIAIDPEVMKPHMQQNSNT